MTPQDAGGGGGKALQMLFSIIRGKHYTQIYNMYNILPKKFMGQLTAPCGANV